MTTTARCRRRAIRWSASSAPSRIASSASATATTGCLQAALGNWRRFLAGFVGFVLASFLLVPFLGANFFPTVDAGQVLMHVRLPVGTRVEETAVRFAQIERAIRTVIPAEEIETPVAAGEVLAEIDTPDLDQELQQAREELERARSDAALANTTAWRWQALLEKNLVARQDVDERLAHHAAAQAAVNALQANVDRIQALRQYRRLTAPFDGIVTVRNTDIGALIDVGSSSGSELFVVSDTHRLRIYVNVPQRQVATIHTGEPRG